MAKKKAKKGRKKTSPIVRTAPRKDALAKARRLRGPGNPKKVITPAQMKKAEGYALDGCQNGTIAVLMDWDQQWLEGSKDTLRKLTKKRAERKLFKRKEQDKHAITQVSMSIFQGKNELGQMDKPPEDHNVNIVVEIVRH